MKRAIVPFVVALSLGLAAQSASATQKAAGSQKSKTVSLSSAPAAVQKTVKAKAGDGQVVRVEKEHEHGKTVYEAVISKDGKETGIQVAASGKYLGTHDEAQERKVEHEKK